MRYSEQREEIFKGLAQLLKEKRPEGLPVPVATPQLLKDPIGLAFLPVSNRASRRKNLPKRRFKFPTLEKPWSAA